MSKYFHPISPVVKGLAQDLGLEKGMAASLLQARWKEVVGPQIASHTYPLEIRFSTLILLVDGAVWMHELSFLKKEMIKKANRLLGRSGIQNLHLKIGPLPSHLTSIEDKPALAEGPGEEELALLDQELSLISDGELRGVISQAMRRHLRKREEIGGKTGRSHSFDLPTLDP